MRGRGAAGAFFLLLFAAASCLALDPHKSLTQYAGATWTQMQGLPQDTIRAIAQTSDGYLWLGTDEGLARFDGYEFTLFHKAGGDLPSNSITSLAATPDGGLWIGTADGLVYYRNKKFRAYTVRDGLPDSAISQLYVDRHGALWVVAGISLARFEDGQFRAFLPGPDLPLTSVRNVREDRQGVLWVAGLSAAGTFLNGRFTRVMGAAEFDDMFITPMLVDRRGDLWFGGNRGIVVRTPEGRIRHYSDRDGLPDIFVRALWEDRDGNIWAGTNAGIARFDGARFTAAPGGADSDLVRCIYEDREGNLWVGSNSGLTRYRDTPFTVYGKPEGLPSDEPNTVFQDRSGRIWVGFHDAGLMLLSPGPRRVYGVRDGLPNSEIFSIRQAADGDLLIGARGGLVRMHGGRFTTYVPPDPLSGLTVFDALEDRAGTIWMATPGGLGELRRGAYRLVVPGAPVLLSAMVTLGLATDGAIWSGSYGRGLWRDQGGDIRHFTTADGLPNDQIRAVHQDSGGAIWIGTFGGGLARYKDGRFTHFSQREGLLSDNIADITEDRSCLWLSTTRGICRISKTQLNDFAAGRRPRLEPVNYGLQDGLRSAQCSPSYPAAGGGHRTADGRLWFTTARGLAVFDPRASQPPVLPPALQILDFTVNEKPVDLSAPARIGPGTARMQIRYTAIHLAAPDRVRYSYRLEGLDAAWSRPTTRRIINFNSLRHGDYRFTVRAELPGGVSAERSFAFVVLPEFYETAWFRALAVAALLAIAWGLYRLRLRRIRSRFAAVLQERARLAREIHDTLAQGFVGISSQLDAVAMCLPDEQTPARQSLDLARRMARHSLTEARRSVMDLRASVLEGQDLAAALESGSRMWAAGSEIEVQVEVSGETVELPQDLEQHLLRVAQEAVTNALKHAGAARVVIRLHREPGKLYLRIADNGRGFDPDGAFASRAGHFGLIGMRERAERIGGEFRLSSQPGQGTEVEVKIPLP